MLAGEIELEEIDTQPFRNRYGERYGMAYFENPVIIEASLRLLLTKKLRERGCRNAQYPDH